jgi:hypothetical protein
MNFPKSSRRVRVPCGVIPLLALVAFSMVSARADTPASGTYVINGKPVELKFAKVIKGEPFDNKATTVVILTEKDSSKSKNPENDTMFGKLGGGLILTITSDGELVGTQVVKDKVQFSASGNVKLSDYKAEGGKVTGKVATDGPQTFFKDTWQIDLTFTAAGP